MVPGNLSRRHALAGDSMARLRAAYTAYVDDLARHAPLSEETRRTYASKVRGFLTWLADTDAGGDALMEAAVRDRAVSGYRTYLAAVADRAPATINNALAAIDDFYARRGLGPAAAPRLDVPERAPQALPRRVALRWLRAVNQLDSARDRALALTPFYAGPRIAEIVRLDCTDVVLSRRTGLLRLSGSSGAPREIDMHPALRTAYADWLTQRPHWRGADTCPAVFLNHRGHRLSTRGANDIFTAIAEQAALNHPASANVLRHTFATTLVRGGSDLALVAELLGHTRLDQTRRYTQPTARDRRAALDLLPVDHRATRQDGRRQRVDRS